MTAETSLTLKDHMAHDIEFDLDSQGDLSIYDSCDGDMIYVAKDQLPKLRDWLNKVIPNE